MTTTLHFGDNLPHLRGIATNSIDAIVTDPPYGISFMNAKWDYDIPSVETWKECLRVLKPGGHMLAFASTRTQHRMACRIEDAGFEIRDLLAYAYGSGFPKSLDVSKAIDKALGAERTETIGTKTSGNAYLTKTETSAWVGGQNTFDIKAPASDEAKNWQGWKTSLKPAFEPITLARKPLSGTVAQNVLAYGTGALNIDGCRVGDEVRTTTSNGIRPGAGNYVGDTGFRRNVTVTVEGRYPANILHDDSEEVHDVFGHASRFFYGAKASKKDRDEGLDGFELCAAGGLQGRHDGSLGSVTMSRNTHPTVKPTDLMRYLCRLITPPGGTILDPYMGSGSTGKAAALEGFDFIGCEIDQTFYNIATARIDHAGKNGGKNDKRH